MQETGESALKVAYKHSKRHKQTQKQTKPGQNQQEGPYP